MNLWFILRISLIKIVGEEHQQWLGVARNSILMEPGYDVTASAGTFWAGITKVTEAQAEVNGRFLQNVDYRYNIRGWLSSINNAQLSNDAGITNKDTTDYFGMELLYNTNEASGLGNTPSYNGNVSAIKWKGQSGAGSGATDQRAYNFNYDYSDRMLGATFTANSGSAWNKEASTLNESATYDANGNILTLTRNQNLRGLSGTTVTSTPQPIDNLTYSYSVGNQMNQVTDASANSAGFNDGANSSTEYAYDSLGNISYDGNKQIDSVKYNVFGKPVRVKFHNGNLVVYTYDASGKKLKMASTVNSVTTSTDYVNNFVYSNAALSFFSSPEGRVVNNNGSYEYQYAITDHLGNTRVVFTSATPPTQSVTATFEAANQTTESSEFSNYGLISAIANHTPGGTNSQYLNGGYAGMIGVGKSYQVLPGDQLKIEAYGSYNQPSSSGSQLGTLAGALLAAFGLPTPAPGESGTAASGVNTWGGIEAAGYGDGTRDNTDPKAFVNIILFDANYKFLDVAYAQLKGTTLYYMTASYTVKQAGYAYLYVSNEQSVQTDVYFDDVKMSYTPNRVVQYNEYYPFGLQAANSWTRSGAVANNFLGNGGSEMNTTTQVYDLEWRNYDPALGRLNQVDLMADKYGSLSPYHYSFNNPVGFNDPSGLDPLWGLYTRDEYNAAIMGRDQAYARGGNASNYDSSPEAAASQVNGGNTGWYKVTTQSLEITGQKVMGMYDPNRMYTVTLITETDYFYVDPGQGYINVYESNQSAANARRFVGYALIESGLGGDFITAARNMAIKTLNQNDKTNRFNDVMNDIKTVGDAIKSLIPDSKPEGMSKLIAEMYISAAGAGLIAQAEVIDQFNEFFIVPRIKQFAPDYYDQHINPDPVHRSHGGAGDSDGWGEPDQW